MILGGAQINTIHKATLIPGVTRAPIVPALNRTLRAHRPALLRSLLTNKKKVEEENGSSQTVCQPAIPDQTASQLSDVEADRVCRETRRSNQRTTFPLSLQADPCLPALTTVRDSKRFGRTQ